MGEYRCKSKKKEQRNRDGDRPTKIFPTLMGVQWFVIGAYRTCILKY